MAEVDKTGTRLTKPNEGKGGTESQAATAPKKQPHDDGEVEKAIEVVRADLHHQNAHGTMGAKFHAGGGTQGAAGFNPAILLPVLLALLDAWKAWRASQQGGPTAEGRE